MRLLPSVCVAAVAFVASSARAEPSRSMSIAADDLPPGIPAAAKPKPKRKRPPAPPRPPTHRQWYGYETLMADLFSVSVTWASAGKDFGPSTALGLTGYVVGGPIVHAANGEWGHAGGSLALRVGLPAVGFFLGIATYQEARDAGPGLQALFFGAIGALAASVIDVAALSYKEVPDAPTPRFLGLTPRLSIDPHGGFRASIGGTF